MKISVIVYSPIRLFADGVAQCLADAPEVEAAACCSLERLEAVLGQTAADVLLFDVTDIRELAAAGPVIDANPQVRAVALALPEVLDRVIACADLGFVSYVPRGASISELREIVARAVRREVLCDPAVAGGLLRELQRRSATGDEQSRTTLTRREQEVLACLSQGLTNKEIARRLGLSAATVKNHVHSILGKTHSRRRGDVAAHQQRQFRPAAVATVVESRKAEAG